MINQTPEELARDRVDQMLQAAGLIIHSKSNINLAAGKGVALQEYQSIIQQI